MTDKELAYESGIVNGSPCKCVCVGERTLTEEEHRALYKPMNQGIRRNGRPK